MLRNRMFAASRSVIVLFNCILLSVLACGFSQFLDRFEHTKFTDEQGTRPPVAEVVPHVDTLHGDVRSDDYYWLRDKSNPGVIEYLEAENGYTEAMMEHTKGLQEKLYEEILSRIKETDLSVPEKLDDYYYYSRTEKGKQYRIHCRKKRSLDSEEEILLDQNELAVGQKYLEVGIRRISSDHRFLAYSIDTTGSERYTLYIKDLEGNELLKDKIPNVGHSMAWANDNKTIFYTVLDEANRPHKLCRHTLGSGLNEDAIVYHEKDDEFWLHISKAKSKEYLIMDSGSWTTSEVHYLKANCPTGNFKLVHLRQPGIEYHIDHHSDKFYIVTNENAKNFKLMAVSVQNSSKENWKEVIPHRDSVKIESLDVFKEYLVVYERENGLKKIRITNLASNEVHYVDFPEPVYTFWQGGNPDFDSNTLRFTYTSLVTPKSVFDYNMDTRVRELKKQYEVLGGYDRSLYQSERVFARAQDGTMIPISLAYKKELVKDSNNPMYLVGYGAYGTSTDPYFSSIRLSLLERGFIYGIAHVRGGGEMGRYWYEQGKFLSKMNTFTDFVTCAEHLIAEKYTSGDRLVITGGSAGGLLIGAVTNLRPDLFEVVVADVPFVDVINTLLDTSIPLTAVEHGELGNPHEKRYYDYMKSYSPYDNVEAREYPNMLITTSLNDPRVQYWEAAKWAAKLRALKTDENILLLKTNMGAGHMGASGRYDYLRDIAFEYAFVLDLLGMGE